MRLLLLLALVLPNPPTLCLTDPVMDSFTCPNDDTRYYFVERAGCDEPVIVDACGDPPAEDSDDFAPIPPVDPDYDEFDPIGPVDGPGEGPGNAPPVDHPDLP